MSKIYLGIGLALVLVFCGAASAATIPVNQLSGNFQGTNPSVAGTTTACTDRTSMVSYRRQPVLQRFQGRTLARSRAV